MNKWTFVLKDKGTNNQGWWLKILTIEELGKYYEQTYGVRYGKVFENFVYGKEFNDIRKGSPSNRHMLHHQEATLTECIVNYASRNNLTILQGISRFVLEVVQTQIECIRENGAIYINRVGGYHSAYENEPKYDFVHREKLIFPDFKQNQIRIEKFPYGNHFYAYIGDTQVRCGDVLKWNTYEEAYKCALEYVS